MTTRNEEAPPCPKCGSINTAWNGAFRILCRNCGRTPRVGTKPRERPDYIKRPRCPRCGTRYAIEHSSYSWLCGKCGKVWSKEVISEDN